MTIRSLMADDHQWLLLQLEQVSSELGIGTLAAMAMAGWASNDLAGEPDLYSFSGGEVVMTRSFVNRGGGHLLQSLTKKLEMQCKWPGNAAVKRHTASWTPCGKIFRPKA